MAIIAKCLGTAADTSPLDILTEAKFKRVGVDYGMDTHRVRLYWGTGATGTKLCTELYFPSGYDGGNGYIGISSDNSFGSFGTMKLWISQNIPDYLSDLSTEIAIPQGAVWSQSYAAAGGGGSDNIDIYLPRITAGTVILWVDRNGRTYYDESYATVAQGTIAFLTKSDTATVSDSVPKKSGWGYFDNLPISLFSLKFNPRRYPIETLEMFDSIVLNSARHATIVGWQFSPDYRVLFDDIGDKKNFATTNWAPRITDYSSINKSIKHWSGDFSVGDWSPTFADIDSELFGSMFSGTLDARYRDLSLRIMHHNKPLQYITQFRGIVDSAEWRDGLVTITVRDLLGELPYRVFVHDWKNLGTTIAGETYGVVTDIRGTNVYYYDKADVNYIEVKRPGRTVWQSIVSGGVLGGIGFALGGGPIGAAAGFLLGMAGNPPTSDRLVGGYWAIKDYNVIPDDLVKTGQAVKFYAGSVSGIATNMNSPLTSVPERTIKEGTMCQGWKGTLSFTSVEGIAIGDYIYAKLPLFFQDSPKGVIEAILTGSNINKPYSKLILDPWVEPAMDPTKPPNQWIGKPSQGTIYEGDFAENWKSEWGMYQTVEISRTYDAKDNISPFDAIKSIAKDMLVDFYVNENNKFAIRAIRPRGLFGTTGLATYGTKNILDGFSFKRSVEEAKAGIRLYYEYIGETAAYGNGFNQLLEHPFHRKIRGVEDWIEIESEWIQDLDTAEMIAYRAEAHYGTGVDRINIPTTLYGAVNSVADLIKVSHTTGSVFNKLYEVESVKKDFSRSLVTLDAVDVERVYGLGNDVWDGTQQPTGSYNISGYGWVGPASIVGTLGTLNGTLRPGEDYADLGQGRRLFWSRYLGHLVTFGTGGQPRNRGWEVAYVEDFKDYESDNPRVKQNSIGGLILRRGLFNTIEQHLLPGKYIYDLGYPTVDPNTGEILPNQIDGVSFNLATTLDINQNLGTVFRFF